MTRVTSKPGVANRRRSKRPEVRARVDAEAEVIRKRRREVLEMRRHGAAYREIGSKLDISHEQARRDHLAALKEVTAEPAEEALRVDLDRIDGLMLTWYRAARDRDEKAAAVVLSLLRERAKLLGLYAPERRDVTTGGKPIRELSDEELMRIVAGDENGAD